MLSLLNEHRQFAYRFFLVPDPPRGSGCGRPSRGGRIRARLGGPSPIQPVAAARRPAPSGLRLRPPVSRVLPLEGRFREPGEGGGLRPSPVPSPCLQKHGDDVSFGQG